MLDGPCHWRPGIHSFLPASIMHMDMHHSCPSVRPLPLSLSTIMASAEDGRTDHSSSCSDLDTDRERGEELGAREDNCDGK